MITNDFDVDLHYPIFSRIGIIRSLLINYWCSRYNHIDTPNESKAPPKSLFAIMMGGYHYKILRDSDEELIEAAKLFLREHYHITEDLDSITTV
jgi:hypothetical protein